MSVRQRTFIEQHGSWCAPRRLDRRDIDFCHVHHCAESASRFFTVNGQRLGQHAWRDLPGDAPPILAPAACALFTAIADDRVPVAVSITLIFRGDLERERLVVLEHRAAIETGAGDSGHGELHGQHIGLFAAWIVAGCMVDGSDPAVYKSLGVKGCGVLCILGGTKGKSSSWQPPPVSVWVAYPAPPL